MTQNIPSSEKTATRWYYADAQNQAVGPVSTDDLNKMAAAGIVTPETAVIPEGGTEWQPYHTLTASRPAVPPPLVTPSAPAKARRWPAVLSVLLLYPFGLIVLWLSKGYSAKIKALITAGSGLLFLLFISTGHAAMMVLTMAFNAQVFIWTAHSLNRKRQIAFSALAGFLFLPILAGAFAPSGGHGSNSSQSGQKAAPAEPPAPAVKIGTEFSIGDFRYKILGTSNVGQIGDYRFGEKSSPGAVFVIVRYQITVKPDCESASVYELLAEIFATIQVEETAKNFLKTLVENGCVRVGQRGTDFLPEIRQLRRKGVFEAVGGANHLTARFRKALDELRVQDGLPPHCLDLG